MDFINNIYVINLDHHIQRLNNITNEINSKLKRQFIRIPGIYGNDLKDYSNIPVSTMCTLFCTPSSIGCALSHNLAWKTALKNNDNYAIFCEDDCQFQSNFIEQFNKIFPQIPSDFDFVFLGCEMGCNINQEYNLATDLLLKLLKITRNRNNKFKKINDNVFIPEYPLGFHCYLVSKTGLLKLTQLIDKQLIQNHIDLQIIDSNDNDNNLFNLNIYAINPNLAIQPTTIESTSNIKSKYPYTINYIFNKLTEKTGKPLSYYLSISNFQIFGYQVSLWTLIFFIIGLLLGFYFPKISIYQIILWFFILNIPELLLSSPIIYMIASLIVLLGGFELVICLK